MQEISMDKAFWQNIKAHDFAVPAGYSMTDLTSELLSYLGSTDPDLRERAAYRILLEWIDRDSYSHAELWEMAVRLGHNLTIGLGAHDDDTVFLRAYSSLILTEIVYYDLIHPGFSGDAIHVMLDQALAYLPAENDLRDYIPEKEWAHAVAHNADCLLVLSKHPLLSVSDLMRILEVIAERITAPVDHVYVYDEEARLVRPVMVALQRDLLALPFLSVWLERLVHPREPIDWSEEDAGEHTQSNTSEVCARHNTKSFLYSLYFQLRAPGFAHLPYVNLPGAQQRPAITDELLPLVEHALSRIRAWY